MKVGIIGSGNVAWHLIRGFQQTTEGRVSWVYSRNQQKLADFPDLNYLPSLESVASHHVDLILLCVNDDAIQHVLHQLPAQCSVAYTSGTVSLEKLQFKHVNCGVFYPLQTFTKGTAVDLQEVPFLIEATNTAFKTELIKVAQSLSMNVQEMNSEERKKLHIAAVFTNNFINHLLLLANDQLIENHLDKDLLHPLLKETVRKAMVLGPFMAQSGPARRMDQKTIDAHLHELNGIKKEIYELLTTSIINTYSKNDI